MKRHLFRIGLSLLVLTGMLLHAAGIVPVVFLDRIETFCYDMRLKISLSQTPDPRIVIVDIDEKSLAEEGRWPWGRDRLARLLDILFESGAVVVGFDMVFAEKDESSGLKILERLELRDLKEDAAFAEVIKKLRPRLNYDMIFARSMENRPVALGYYFTDTDRVGGQLPPPVLRASAFEGLHNRFVSMTGYGANLPLFQERAMSTGHFTPLPDDDGVTRRVPMLIEYRGDYYEALSLAIVRALLGNPEVLPGIPTGTGSGDYNRIEWLAVSDLRIPVDDQVAAFVPYRGKKGSFRYVSASDVLQKRYSDDVFDGAIILVGTTSPGLMDLRATPVSAVFPGVEVNANMIAGILDQTIKHKPAYAMGAELLILAGTGLLLSFLLPYLSPFKSACAGLLTLAGVIGLNYWAWQHHLIMPLATTIMMIPLICALDMSYGYFVENRAKRQITGLFGQYVPPNLVDEMSRNPDVFTMDGESRELTVLFADVRNFTALSETLTPRELSKMMNEYLSAMTAIIQHNRGTIDKYIGDAIMAFWGAPMPDAEHARNSILAALAMQRTMANLRPRFAERGWPEIHIGIGLNTGVMRVGNMGSQFRIAYTVMGDAVNLGARLESLTKEYGVGILVGEATRNALPDIVWREIDLVCVKGKNQPVTIFEPLGLYAEVSEAILGEVSRFEEFLMHYRAREWDDAESLLHALQKDAPHSVLYDLYRKRILYFRSHPPEDSWDCVFQYAIK